MFSVLEQQVLRLPSSRSLSFQSAPAYLDTLRMKSSASPWGIMKKDKSKKHWKSLSKVGEAKRNKFTQYNKPMCRLYFVWNDVFKIKNYKNSNEYKAIKIAMTSLIFSVVWCRTFLIIRRIVRYREYVGIAEKLLCNLNDRWDVTFWVFGVLFCNES